MSRMLNFKKLHAGLRFAVRRRGGQAVGDSIDGDHKIFRRLDSLTGPDQVVDTVVIAAYRSDHKYCVGLVGIERPMRHVGHREVLDGFTAFELKVAQCK